MTTYKQVIDEAGDIERHADPIDIASDRSSQEVTHLVREARTRAEEDAKAAVAQFTGRCLQCDEPVEAPRRWCDRACASDYEKQRGRRG